MGDGRGFWVAPSRSDPPLVTPLRLLCAVRTPVPQQAATFALKDAMAHGVRLRQEGLAQGLLAGNSDGTRLPALHAVYATCGLLAGAGVALGRAALEAARPVVPSSGVLTSPALPSAWTATGGGVQLRAAVAGAALYNALYFGIHDAMEVGGGTRTARATLCCWSKRLHRSPRVSLRLDHRRSRRGRSGRCWR